MTKPSLSGNLDLLRTIAVACVFLHHLALTAWRNNGFETLGRFGVILFFVHTSYVLMASLQRMAAHPSSDLSVARAFWIRRFFRIYPLAIVCVLAVALFRIPPMPLDSYHWIGLKGLLSNLALSQNLSSSPNLLGPLWSLPLEVQMYLILPFAYFAICGGRYRSILLWLLALAPSCLFPHIASERPFQILVFMPCFAAGIIAYDVARHGQRGRRLPFWTWPVGILALLLLFRPYDPAGFSEKYLQCWALALGVGVLYAFVREAPHNWFYAGCRWTAERSYGIYLSHCIVLWIVFHRMAALPLWLQIPITVAGVLGVSSLLYRVIEQPLIRVGVEVAKGSLKTTPQAAVPAPA